MFGKLCDGFTKLMMLWVVLAGVLGYGYPPALKALNPCKDWLFAFTMLGIGLVLKPEDFMPILTKPHLVLLGTLPQFAIMPATGFLVAKALSLEPHLALGVVLVGAVPDAMATPVITYLAKADVPYSTALTCCSTFLSPVLTPFFTNLFAHESIDIAFWPMFFDILKMVVVPVILGLGISRLAGERIQPIIKVFPAMSTLFIAFICGLVVALNKDRLASVSLVCFIAVFIHNGLGLLLGYWAGFLLRFDKRRRRTLSIEVGMQNAGLGALLALHAFADHPQSALPSALFATWSVITASSLALIWSRRE